MYFVHVFWKKNLFKKWENFKNNVKVAAILTKLYAYKDDLSPCSRRDPLVWWFKLIFRDSCFPPDVICQYDPPPGGAVSRLVEASPPPLLLNTRRSWNIRIQTSEYKINICWLSRPGTWTYGGGNTQKSEKIRIVRTLRQSSVSFGGRNFLLCSLSHQVL